MSKAPPKIRPESPVHLLPCPFCGSPAQPAKEDSVPPDAGTWWQVQCSNEKQVGCSAWRSGASIAEVAARWNSRSTPELDALMEIVEGVRNQRWSASGRRLVDTQEWAALFVAWKRQTNRLNTSAPAPEPMGVMSVEQLNQEFRCARAPSGRGHDQC